jgi:hypothetical protein
MNISPVDGVQQSQIPTESLVSRCWNFLFNWVWSVSFMIYLENIHHTTHGLRHSSAHERPAAAVSRQGLRSPKIDW